MHRIIVVVSKVKTLSLVVGRANNTVEVAKVVVIQVVDGICFIRFLRNLGNLTCSIITTAANELMSEIHNTKKRMPVILNPEAEKAWLGGGELVMQNDYLKAVPCE